MRHVLTHNENSGRWYVDQRRTKMAFPSPAQAVRADYQNGNKIRAYDRNHRVRWVKIDGISWTLHRTTWKVSVSSRSGKVIIRYNNRVLKKWTAAVGSPSAPTPKGSWIINRRWRSLSASALRVYGPRVMVLDAAQYYGALAGKTVAFHHGHGSDYGRRVSFGCIRLSQSQIDWMWRTLPLGTPVQVT